MLAMKIMMGVVAIALLIGFLLLIEKIDNKR
jgi:hypothetical protein